MTAPRRAGGRPAPTWQNATVAALAAIVLLVAATVGAAVWLAVVFERREAAALLGRHANQVALQLRSRLLETEQLLLFTGDRYPSAPARFQSDMESLLAANPALLRAELRTRGGLLLQAVDAPAPRPALPDPSRQSPGVEASGAIESAAQLNRLTYSHPYFTRIGEGGIELLELVVPTGDAPAPLIVATYSPQRMIDHLIARDTPQDQRYSLTETDGTVVVRQPSLEVIGRPMQVTSTLSLPGTSLMLRVDAPAPVPRLIPNLQIGLVAAMSVGLGLALFMLLRDVRRRDAAEHELRQQVAFRRAIEDAMVSGLAVFDMAGRIVHVNAALCRITGFAREDLVGASGALPFATAESTRDYRAFRESRAQARHNGDPDAVRGFETILQRKDGTRFPAMVSQTAMLDADARQTGWLTLCADLTDQKQVEDLARRQQEILQSRSRLATLGELASTLSHEVNQPLAAITSFAAACENLLARHPERPEPIRQALRGIKAQAERAGQVIHSVQSFLRRRAIERTACDLAGLMRGLEPLMRLQAVRTGSVIDIQVPAGATVFADRIMLEQVLLNLTRNGFEAMAEIPPERRVLELRARPVHDDERGDRIEVSVLDRGPGVPPEVLPNLFTSFFTTKKDGMGLGLSVCRSVIEQHGGQLAYRPRVPTGAIFSFDLPAFASAARNERPQDREPAPPPAAKR